MTHRQNHCCQATAVNAPGVYPYSILSKKRDIKDPVTKDDNLFPPVALKPGSPEAAPRIGTIQSSKLGEVFYRLSL
jgi:hypothetical protein